MPVPIISAAALAAAKAVIAAAAKQGATKAGTQIIKATTGKSNAAKYAAKEAKKAAAKKAEIAARKASKKALSNVSKTKVAEPKSAVKVVQSSPGNVDRMNRQRTAAGLARQSSEARKVEKLRIEKAAARLAKIKSGK